MIVRSIGVGDDPTQEQLRSPSTWTASYSAQNIWARSPLSLGVCIKQWERTNGGRQETHFSLPCCLETNITRLVCWVVFITLLKTILHGRDGEREITRERRNEFIMTDGPGCLPTSKAPAIWQRLHRRAIHKKRCPCGMTQLLKDNPRKDKRIQKYSSGDQSVGIVRDERLCVRKSWESDEQNASHWLCSER